MTEEIKKTLDERGKDYGSYPENAAISQALKRVVRPHLVKLKDTPADAIEMTLTKIARLLNGGDGSHVDSWRDIIGYATLAFDWAQSRQQQINVAGGPFGDGRIFVSAGASNQVNNADYNSIEQGIALLREKIETQKNKL